MEFIPVLLCIIVIILILTLKNNIQDNFARLEEQINALQKQLAKKRFYETPDTVKPETPPVVEIIPPLSAAPTPVIEATPAPVAEPVKEQSLAEELETLLQNATGATTKPEPATITTPEIHIPPIAASVAPQPVKKPGFMERNPDLEKFIGENLISKIGIAILVLAIGFFVKYAIDNDWIGSVGRVGIGIFCGGILVYLGHRMRLSYKAFSSVLIGGGLAIFYFTITLAYHQFHIFSQTVAFIIMVVITAFAVVLSQLNNRQELAIIALIGGFATPFMASKGSGNFQALFVYLIILNAGLLVIAYNKAWRLLNILAFIFTATLFAAWLYSLDSKTLATVYMWGLLYATIFYLMFFAINVAHNIRNNKQFLASDFSILLANTCLYFSSGLYLLSLLDGGKYKGLFTALIGVFNLIASFFLLRNRKIDKNILYLLIGITLSFISLTAPIQLNGHNITLFWAAETVLLYWLYQKSRISIIRFASLLVWVAMLLSMMMDWVNVYNNTGITVNILLNRGFITTIFSAIACYLLYFLMKKEDSTLTGALKEIVPAPVFRVASIVLLYAAGVLEINHQFQNHYPGTGINLLYLLLFTFAFVWVLTRIFNRFSGQGKRPFLQFALLAICIITYVFTISEVFAIQRMMLETNLFSSQFLAHWLGAVFLFLIVYAMARLVRSEHEKFKPTATIITWAVCIAIIIFVSAEGQLLFDNIYYSATNNLAKIQRIFIKTGLPILWGLCSFGFMWLGMKYKFRTLRIVSLSLFLVILIKLFVSDIRNIPVAGKIAAFFSLGVLLLVVSFMYQLSKIILFVE